MVDSPVAWLVCRTLAAGSPVDKTTFSVTEIWVNVAKVKGKKADVG